MKNKSSSKAIKIPKAARANPYLTDIEKFMNSMGVKKKRKEESIVSLKGARSIMELDLA